jgi:hypothetical protein
MTEAPIVQSVPAPSVKTKKNRPSLKKILLTGLVILLLAISAAIGFLYYQTRQELKRISSQKGQQELSKQEVQAVVSELEKLTLLPEEEPVLATILNAPYLATQSAFYEKAQNGDKLIVYPKAQKAYIYSPERHIIVNAGPLIMDQGQGQTQAQPMKVEIRNGSSTLGAGTRLKSKVEGNGAEVIAVTDAANKEYRETIVIPINKAITAEQLKPFAETINGKVVTSVPSGEATSHADVLVIVGGTAPAASPTPTPQQ